VIVFAKEKVSFGPKNALLLLAGQLSLNVQEEIKERFGVFDVPRPLLEEFTRLRGARRLDALLEFFDEHRLAELAREAQRGPARYTRSPDEDRLRLISVVLLGLAGLSAFLGGALALGGLSQGKLGPLPLALGMLLCNLAVAANAVLFLRRGTRKRALWTAGLACVPVVGPVVFLGLPLGLYALKLAHDIQADRGFEPPQDWRQGRSD